MSNFVELIMIEIFLVLVCIALIAITKRQIKIYWIFNYMDKLYNSILDDCKDFKKSDIEFIKRKIKLYNDYYNKYKLLKKVN